MEFKSFKRLQKLIIDKGWCWLVITSMKFFYYYVHVFSHYIWGNKKYIMCACKPCTCTCKQIIHVKEYCWG